LCSLALLDLHSFPTLRSSDLVVPGFNPALRDFDDAVRNVQALGCRQIDGEVAQVAIVDADDSCAVCALELLLVMNFDERVAAEVDRKSTRLNSSHDQISYAVF